jgi:hypothetical protein
MLNHWDRSVLAQAYGLGDKAVVADAMLVVRWRGPLDDLLAQLRERHSWTAVVAYRYLRAVHQSLRGSRPS